jgi:hypothetical protein
MTAIEYARRVRGVSLDAQNDAAEIVLKAERELGRMLGDMEKDKGGRPKKTGDIVSPVSNLEEMGIHKKQSSRWQSEAAVPEEEFRDWVKQTRDRSEPLFSGHLVKLGRRYRAMHPGKKPKSKRALGIESLTELVEAGKKFATIYADPPWQYSNQTTRAATDNHYPTMTLDAIAAEPVAELAAENAHLHLWTTNGFVREAFTIIDAWGFVVPHQ